MYNIREYNDSHISVLVNECIQYLVTKKDGIYVDCTAGEGGHIKAICEYCEDQAKIIGVDIDHEVLQIAEQKLKDHLKNVKLIKAPYQNIDVVLAGLGIEKVDGFLMDLGVSTFQLKAEDRGFSFLKDEPLDMRMDPESEVTAADIVNNYPEEKLRQIIFEYGEEKRFAYKIAKSIVRNRPINTTSELVNAVRKALPNSEVYKRKIHFATKTFQAIRIEVNNELKNLEEALSKFEKLLNKKGRVVIITFHSLEDRIVKNFFKSNDNYNLITSKPLLPSEIELNKNPRSRSAKLRIAEFIGTD
ncbi:MAG: 16S rRNA (cytosine(1402)-N(4))-methyltransferase RsmH [Defluviitoga tunisiensis]|nr:16S rRNA (cytosine(1402)-N(4))-methyltransferase RsmH [Defluviitoga tunisiensis]MDY0379566.1 16S rRNA (cytosine(1402)-N(4))-methyltransferase RsmH [Defluviitoga tunisiensis]HOB55987.1 16S rRNA (cytosine(1402)-N(4))-methyltransferase RsmH [Defluviitoga tunisiensis]HOK16831.1 16S rRNA (cytosine(1402)-N(4))-methyltransferase RsmH [Defluviitoga tunisiensis]HOL87115.1 16S rRNA (cytosine(1402)-N(4))-methyltransferase RsmH [Defluviitoga tunisiensis]